MAAGAVLATLAGPIDDAVNFHNTTTNAKSLVGLTKAARVEPLTLIDSDCVHLAYITDVLQSVQSLFTGYWLQGLDMLTNVGGCSVLSILDPINPNRDPDYMEFAKSVAKRHGMESYTHMSVESYKFSLPMPGKKTLQTSLEADKPAKAQPNGAFHDPKATADIGTPSNLAVGKMMNVTIRNGDKEISMPISIRLMVAEMPRESMIALVGDQSQNTSLSERFFEWRAGRISMINDLIFCSDLIKERKKMLVKDKAGVYTEVRRRQLAHKKAGVLTGQASAAEASNLYIISKDTAQDIADRFGLDIDNFSHRCKIFENTTAMIIVVIDREYERVTFYHEGLRQSTNLGINDIKSANKNTGPNVMDIFQAYKEGAAPRY